MRTIINRLFQMEEINGNHTCPTYLYRWTILRLGSWCALYVHKFVGDDWSLDKHDHPKRFISIGLRGGYIEFTPSASPKVWVAPWIRTFPAEHVHRLAGPTRANPCWTIVIVGRAVRSWGFWRLGEFIPWRQYVDSAEAKANRSCP